MLEDCGAESCSADDIIELANGCICCTVADDFLPSMQQLLAQEPRPDHIIIETSGLALPQPLVQAFNWPDIRNQVMLDGVVTLVDGPALADGGVAHDLAAEAQRALTKSLTMKVRLTSCSRIRLAPNDYPFEGRPSGRGGRGARPRHRRSTA